MTIIKLRNVGGAWRKHHAGDGAAVGGGSTVAASLRPPSQTVALSNPLADDEPSLLEVPSTLDRLGESVANDSSDCT